MDNQFPPDLVASSLFDQARIRRCVFAFVVALFVGLLASMLLASSADAQGTPPVELDGLTVSCPGMGRIDFTLLNLSAVDVEVTVGIDRVLRQLTVPANASITRGITGRPDGTRFFSIDGVPVEELQIRCTDNYGWRDQFAGPGMLQFSEDDGEVRSYMHTGSSPLTLEPGESETCVDEDFPGTEWLSAIAPGTSLSLSGSDEATVGVYVSAVDATPQTIADLSLLTCGAAGDLPTVPTKPGATVWLQVSGPPIRFVYAVANGLPTLTHAADVECRPSGGLVSLGITNESTEVVDVTAKFDTYSRAGVYSHVRSTEVAPGETGTVRVGSRADGLVDIVINGLVKTKAWVDCVPNTGPNDTIATADLIDLADGAVFKRPRQNGNYGHAPEEIPVGRCIHISEGTAWFKVVAPSERLVIDGFDGQVVAFFGSSVENPTQLSELTALGCGAPRDTPSAITIPGETYWIAASRGHFLPWKLYGLDTPVNDTLATARPLVDFDTASNAASVFEDGEPSDCVGAGYALQGTLWWKWTADEPVLNLEAVSFFPGSVWTAGYGDVGLFTSDVMTPSFDDLDLVECADSRPGRDTPVAVTVGETYWIQLQKQSSGMVAVSTSPIDVSMSVEASCVAGRGRIDAVITNNTPVDVSGVVTLKNRGLSGDVVGLSRDVAVESNQSDRVTVTGRPDGYFDVRLRLGTTELVEKVTVKCQLLEGSVAVKQTCESGKGRFDVLVAAGFGSSYGLILEGPTSTITRSLGSTSAGSFTVTGRPNGDYQVTVIQDLFGTVLFDDIVTVSC